MIFLSLKKTNKMFPKVLKIILAVLSFSYGIYQIIDDYIGNGVMFILLGGMFILLYFKNELIFLAFLRLRKQDFEGTEKWLIRIPNIERNLVKKQQGYYNYLMGIIQSQKNLTKAEKYFKAAAERISKTKAIEQNYLDTIENNAQKGFKKQKMMDTFIFNPSKYSLENKIITFGNKITQFQR